jgi:putative hemolysin
MVIHRIPTIFIIAVCIAASIAAVNAEEDSSFQQDPPLIGMPDPSAVFAQQQGYQYVSRTNPDGSQYGITVLPDGSEYDAWELFRQSLQPEQDTPLIGMPDPSAVFAQQQGYQYVSRTNPDGSQYGITVLPDGSEYDAWDLYRVRGRAP